MTEQQRQIIEKYVDSQDAGFFKRTLARKIVMENSGLFSTKPIRRLTGFVVPFVTVLGTQAKIAEFLHLQVAN
jgi:transposase